MPFTGRELNKRGKDGLEELRDRRKQELEDARLRSGMPGNWREMLGLRDAPQDAQNAPGGQDAPAQPREAVNFNVVPHAAQRAQEGRDRQADRLGGMIDRVEQAHRDENDSRVAQAREARRMEFAKDIERMRQESLLQRLAMAQQASPRRAATPPAGGVRVFNPNTLQWEDAGDQVTFGG